MSEDPIGFRSRDWNLYRYVRNKPLIFSDPSGLFSSSGTSQQAICRQETLEGYYKAHQAGVKTCEVELERAMNFCDGLPNDPIPEEQLNQLQPVDNPFDNGGQKDPRGF